VNDAPNDIADLANLHAGAFQAGQAGYRGQANQISSAAQDAEAMGRLAAGFSWAGRAVTLYSVSQQPDALTAGFVATDAVIGEGLTAELGVPGAAASLVYNRLGGTGALSQTQAPAFMAEVQQTNAWMCLFSKIF
jgi:hypothetical protein